MNEAMLRHVNARFLVTKDTGEAGGFPEKIRAAAKCGAVPVVIRRPEEEDGMSVEECFAYLSRRYGLPLVQKKVTVLGAGTGRYGTLTLDAEAALREAELIVGAPRLLASLARFRKETVPAVRAEEIANAVSESRARKIVCVMSGDTRWTVSRTTFTADVGIPSLTGVFKKISSSEKMLLISTRLKAARLTL